MPRLPIDYSKTIIYKIVCNDLSITEVYVGHTTAFKERKWSHKKNCYNEKSKDYNSKVYQYIRENGGWDNFSMIEIEKYPCNDFNEARTRERYWYEELNAKLNMIKPIRTEIENKEYKKQWCERNKDKINEIQKTYEEQNKDKIKERKKLYYQNNLDKMKEREKLYYENNKDKIKEREKLYYENNKDKIKEREKLYYENNKEKLKAIKKLYRENNKEKINEQRRKNYQNKKKRENENNCLSSNILCSPMYPVQENI